MFCIKCGNKIDDSCKFCPSCGYPNGNGMQVNNTVSNSFTQSIPSNVISQKKKSSFDINKILIFLIILVILLPFSIFGFMTLTSKKSRTIMIYMVGSNLESEMGLGSNDLKYLDYKTIRDNKVNVVLIAGGTTSWHNPYINVNESSIFELRESGFEKVVQRSKKNMGSEENLAYFLNYVYSHYKTDKYDFIYWNHGGAVDGSEYDDFTNDNLKPQEMAKAFEASPFKGRHKLEVLSFRTCLNSTLEIANIYKDYANYLVASEEITIGHKFDSALRFINEISPDDDGKSYGNKQIQNYKELVTSICNVTENSPDKEENYCQDSTYSLINLSRVSKIIKEFDAFSKDLSDSSLKNSSEMLKLRGNMDQYAADEKAYDMVDLVDFVSKFKKYSKHSDNVMKLVDDVVLYNFSTNNYSHGLSIYFPYYSNVFLKNYSEISVSDNYHNFVSHLYDTKNGIQSSSFISFSKNDGSVSKVKRDKADVEMELTDEMLTNYRNAGYYVFVDTGDGYHQLVYAGRNVSLDGNKLKADVKGKLLRICDIEYDDECTWTLSVEKEVTDDYSDITTYAFLSKTSDVLGKFFPVNIQVRIDSENPNGLIRSVTTSLDNKNKKSSFAAFSPTGLQITDYPFIRVFSQSYKFLNDNNEYNQNWFNEGNGVYSGAIFRTNEFRLVKEDFSSNYDYYVVFRIFDIANNEYNSKPIKISK